jgi:hypothetical protein
MRRKAPPNIDRPSQPFDIRKDLDQEWLALLGAICVAWNAVNEAIDIAVALVLDIEGEIYRDTVSRINGMDGKLAIIRKAIRLHGVIERQACDLIDRTIGFVSEYKIYRDSLIHAHIEHPEATTAISAQGRGSEFEVLITREALEAVYRGLVQLDSELEEVLEILNERRKELQRWLAPAPEKTPAARLIREYAAQLVVRQSERRALPPLPSFPRHPEELLEPEGRRPTNES